MELLRRNSKGWKLVIIKGVVIHAYLGCTIVAIQHQLVGIASLIKDM
jgi:hypothetical protein